MRTFIPFSLVVGILLPTTQAATVQFEEPTYPSSVGSINGVDGWTQSEPNPDSVSPLFYTIDGGSGNQFGAISGFFDIPASSNFSASRTLDLGGAPNLGETTFSMQVSLQEASTDFPENDTFGFSLASAGNPLIDVVFRPNTLTNATKWGISYTVGGGTQQSTGNAIQVNGLFNMVVSFNTSGLQFQYSKAAPGSTVFTETGIPAGYNPSSTDDLDLDLNWRVSSGNTTYGDGAYLIDNINTVPEPTILGLFGLAGFGLLRRRR